MSSTSYEGIDPPVLYDIFTEMYTNVGGHILAMARHSTTDAEQAYWRHRLQWLDSEYRNIDWRDRDAQITAMNQWEVERDDLVSVLEAREAERNQVVAP